MEDSLLAMFRKTFEKDDAQGFAKLLREHPEAKAQINAPIAAFDAPLVTQVKSPEMLDVLLEAGADINARSRWWAGGFGLLDLASPELATYAISRGATLDAHSAARLGRQAQLLEFLDRNPALVHARGGDGQTPLHFAATVEIAGLLLDRGAAIDATDIDHESTPAQFMTKDRQDVARFLIERGCRTDILMAAAVGNQKLVEDHLNRDPANVGCRVSTKYFPKKNPHSGGIIYIWTFGKDATAHAVARHFGHEEIYKMLMERSSDDLKLIAAIQTGDEATFHAVVQRQPNLLQNLSDEMREELPHAARHNRTSAVKLMLSAGWPVDARGQHRGTALHWACFHGNSEMTQEILRFNPPLELTDADFNSTPLGWAIHGSEHGWYCKTGDYSGTVEALLKAGAELPAKLAGSPPVQTILRNSGLK
jgi:ankyrin repeat protein